ncbi:arsenic transporter [Sorangium cellulosum]|uniref:Arsenic transporter n=1 Tax=Sorangium cellulosum TaxID=56 RepID=A0A150SMM9_SORCE|nr:arsenic transporter [Sorangium cellulosum]
MWSVLLVFAATYVLIAARRLSILPIGRPAGALAGACAMVFLSAIEPGAGLTPHEAFAAIEPNTIGLLLGMMLLSASLDLAGVFEIAAAWVARRNLSPVGLLYLVTLGSGLASAVLLNDSVCVMLAPLVDRTARRAGLDRVPYLLALAMGANAGSALTLAGNPQNMLVGHLSGISYRAYLLEAGPAALVGLAVTAVTLHLLLRRRLAARTPPRDPALGSASDSALGSASDSALDSASDSALGSASDSASDSALGSASGSALGSASDSASDSARPSALVPIACVAVVSVLFVLGANLAWTAVGGATAAILLHRRDATGLFDRVSWTVLVFFGALFIVVAGLQKTGIPEQALRAASPFLPSGPTLGIVGLSIAMLVGCQIVSNVPFILLAESYIRSQPDPHLAWVATALVSTLAGNLTLLGSVANIIVVETVGAEREIGFRSYARVGIPVTLASSAAALLWLLLVR